MEWACILSSVACPALRYFSTLSHKPYDFRGGGGGIEHKMCVLFFRIAYVWNICRSKKDWARYVKKRVFIFTYSTRYSCHILMELENFLERYSTSTSISNFTKIRPVGAELFLEDRQTDMNNLIAVFPPQLCEGALKPNEISVLGITPFNISTCR
jgi:hypothetical protein